MLWKGQRTPKGKAGVPRAGPGEAVLGSPRFTEPSLQELPLCTTQAWVTEAMQKYTSLPSVIFSSTPLGNLMERTEKYLSNSQEV